MNEAGSRETSGAGRPGLGALMKDQLLHEAWSRDKGRGLGPLLRLAPFVRAHPVDAILGLTFMMISSGDTMVETLATSTGAISSRCLISRFDFDRLGMWSAGS